MMDHSVKKLLRIGYKVSEDGTKLEYDEDFKGVRTPKRRRPKKVLKESDNTISSKVLILILKDILKKLESHSRK